MAMDMPPLQVAEYRIERPAPSLMEGMLKAAGTLTQGAKRSADAAAARYESDGRSDLARMLPPIDLKSKSLTQADREALVIASRANREGRLAETGIVMPRGYVAERIRTAMMLENAGRDERSAHAFRCQSVATAMNRLAGSFLDGGVEAADRARRAIPGEWLLECRSRLVSQARDAADRGIRRSVDPAAMSQGVAARTRIDPERSRYARAPINPQTARPVSIEPMGSKRVSIDPTPSRRVSISPQAGTRVRIDPVSMSKGPETASVDAAAQREFLGGRSRSR